MESIVLPCKTTIPSKITENPSKSKIFSRNIPPKVTKDSYLKRLCKLGRLSEAISALDCCGSTVSYSTLFDMIQSCSGSNSLDLCYKLHACVKKLIGKSDPFLETKLVGMFAKCGSLGDAFVVFDDMRRRNLYSWSAIIGACSRGNRWRDVVELFYWMMADGDVVPDAYLFPKILRACARSGDVETGRLIHGMVIKLGMNNVPRVNNSLLAVYARCGWLSSAKRFFEGMEVNDRVTWNAIITGYCQAGLINEARRLFDSMKKRYLEPDEVTWNILIWSCNQLGNCDVAMKLMNEMESHGVKPDIFTWTSMILVLAKNNRSLEALNVFCEMLWAGVEPNGITLKGAISACSSMKDIRKGEKVHVFAIKLGYGEDMLVGNSLLDMYSKCRKLEAARQIFDMISEKDPCTWNSMIAGYCQAGYCGIAHDLFKQMQESDVSPNVVTWNVMITGYIQNGDEEEALDLFYRMEKDGGVKWDTASWNALIAGYLRHGHKNKALGIFRQMQYFGAKPNSITILSILPACVDLIAIKKLKEIHCCVLRSNLESNLSVANSLIDVHAKSGNIKYSKAIFEGMPSIDNITWNSMTRGYVLHGCFNEAIELFERMRRQGYRPNRSTFASIITAYGLAKKAEEGRNVFSNMTEEYNILLRLEHYVAMVNLYGRSGKVCEALDFIIGMAIEPDVSIWSAFLTACCRHGKVRLAIHAGEKLLELEPNNAFVQRLVLQLYDLRGILKDPLKVKRPRIRKSPTEPLGLSFIEYKNIIHTFVTGDIRQLDGKCLLSWTENIELKTKEFKYHDRLRIQEEEREETVGVHSEKLALAFALLKSPQASQTIRIIKNLRMCDQCHRFVKSVSKMHGCEIYIRDSKCLHHFKQGTCSCGDYW